MEEKEVFTPGTDVNAARTDTDPPPDAPTQGPDGMPPMHDECLRADAMRAEAMRARARRQSAEEGCEVKSRPAKPEKPKRRKEPAHRQEEAGDRVERRHDRRPDRFVQRLIWIAIVLALAVVLLLIVLPRFDKTVETLTPQVSVTVPESLQAMLPDETMGYTEIDFTNAILGESRERKELVVMEQDVEVTSRISQDLLRLSIFSKVKIIHSFGTGVYTVALDEVREGDIAVDQETMIITVKIPHTKLTYVNVDVEKTKFEDTQKSLLAIGDIKLTAEQKHMLDQSVDETLHERLNDKALFLKADEIALNKVREILQPIVNSVSDAYVVKIVME